MKEEKRIERKMYFPDKNKDSLIGVIKTHPYGFKETYPERQVNSIYYDTASLDNFWDNENGHENRAKLRIRWYGKDLEPNKEAIIELKMKMGEVGSKIREKVSDNKDQRIKDMFKITSPVIKIYYKRRYFESADRKIRMTVDFDITYEGLSNSKNYSKPYTEPGCVVEIKYDVSIDDKISGITQIFGHRINKFSKYARGIFSCYY